MWTWLASSCSWGWPWTPNGQVTSTHHHTQFLMRVFVISQSRRWPGEETVRGAGQSTCETLSTHQHALQTGNFQRAACSLPVGTARLLKSTSHIRPAAPHFPPLKQGPGKWSPEVTVWQKSYRSCWGGFWRSDQKENKMHPLCWEMHQGLQNFSGVVATSRAGHPEGLLRTKPPWGIRSQCGQHLKTNRFNK